MPIFKLGHAAGLVHDVVARLQVEVVRSRQDGLRTGGANLFRGKCLDRGFGRHRDKGRGLNITVRGVDDTAAAVLTGAFGQALADVETQVHLYSSSLCAGLGVGAGVACLASQSSSRAVPSMSRVGRIFASHFGIHHVSWTP